MEPCLAPALNKIGRSMIFAVQNPFGGEQTFNTNRSTGVNASCWDTDLSAQSKSEAIGKTRAGIVEHTSAVNLALEMFGGEI